jgi:hypothetical protein
MIKDVVLELEDATLDPGDQVAEEADRILDDLPDDPCRSSEHVLEHRDQLADRIDHRFDRTDCLVNKTLVLGLQLLDPVVQALACLDILRGQRVNQ